MYTTVANKIITKKQILKKKTEKAVIEDIQSVVIDGNSIYYIMFEDNPKIYTANITVSNTLPFLEPGDEIEYMASDSMIILIK